MNASNFSNVVEMINKLSELHDLVPYVEKFCRKYRELFPDDSTDISIQTTTPSPEELLKDNVLAKNLRSGVSTNLLKVMKKYNVPMQPLALKIAYEKEYLPNAQKNEIRKSRRNVQQSLLYLIKKNVIEKTTDGKYQVIQEKNENKEEDILSVM